MRWQSDFGGGSLGKAEPVQDFGFERFGGWSTLRKVGHHSKRVSGFLAVQPVQSLEV